MFQLLLAGVYASSVFASPRGHDKKRSGGWDSHRNPSDNGWGKQSTANGKQPWGYGESSAAQSSPWGYGSTESCVASTVYETQSAATVTVTSVSTSVVSDHATTVTLPGSVSTSISTVYHSAPANTISFPGSVVTSTVVHTAQCSGSQVGPVTQCASTVTQTNYVTKSAQGYNDTATETSLITAPGRTITSYEYVYLIDMMT
jgi:hypothetical protein